MSLSKGFQASATPSVYVVCYSPPPQDLPESLDDLLLPLSQDTAADMFVIGTQESTASRWAWHSPQLHHMLLLLYMCADVSGKC